MATRGEPTGSEDAKAEKAENTEAVAGDEAAEKEAAPQAPHPALVDALAAVHERPTDVGAWEVVDALADEHNAPDEVFDAYKATLEHGVGKADAAVIADRAVSFCQAWFIDTPEAMPELLTLIVDKYPEIDWAFDRLVVLLTSGAQWSDLLALYDKSLASTRNEKRRKQLLEDASRLAKDFADAPDRAADYLQQLLTFEPDNEKLVAQLERLLERRERHQDLLTLWRRRLDHQPADEARATRIRIAEISLDQVGSPEQALTELQTVVEDNPGQAEACTLLERILASDADVALRQQALKLLRTAYEVTGRPEDVVRVLTTSLDFLEGEDARSLRREVGNRLGILGRDEDAMEQYAALLRDDPSDGDARRQLRQLARKSGRLDLFVDALLAAAEQAREPADRVALWLSGADVRRRQLQDDDGAIELFRRVLDAPEAEEPDALRAAHQLNELLARQERGADRLTVLERLSSLERSPSLRRQLVAEAARLAESLEDHARAIASWRQLLELEANDPEALAALCRLYETREQWDALATVLRRRADGPVSAEQRRADLRRIAELQQDQEQLASPEDAIATWMAIRKEFGDSPDVLAALDELLTAADRPKDLAQILDRAVKFERGQVATRLVRLGDVLRSKLDGGPDAVGLYRQALELNPADDGARAGARALLDDALCARDAAEALWRAHARQNDTEEQLELVEARLATMSSAAERAALLAEASSMHEQTGDASGALDMLGRAVAADPTQRAWHGPLERLAAEAGDWEQAAKAYRLAAEAAETPSFSAELRQREARIHLNRREDPAAAYEAFAAAATLSGDAQDAVMAARSAGDAGLWEAAAGACVDACTRLGRADTELLDHLHSAVADDPDARRTYADALAKATAGLTGDPAWSSRLMARAAAAYPEDDDPAAAIAAAEKALALQPHVRRAREGLVKMLRRAPQPSLVEHLLVLDEGSPGSLDHQREAAEVALSVEAPALAQRALEQLFNRASELWRAGHEASGQHDAPSCARWALEKLATAIDDRQVVADLLLRGGELPFSPEERSALNRRAADHLSQLDAPLRAIDAYRRALADAPEDLNLIRSLAFLCENEEERSGATALRERELALTQELTPRLSLRLKELERTGALGAGQRQLDLLLANLEEAPGHPASVDALMALLRERREPQRLVDVLQKQATTLEEADNRDRAAQMWLRAAEVAERELDDHDRAVNAYQRVVDIEPNARSFDALARLHLAQDDSAEGARWLTKRLAIAAPKEKVAVRLKLARARLGAGQESDAIATLSEAFAEAPQSAEVRKQLIPLLRQREDWKALATTLVKSVEHTTDDTAVLNYAREAADVLNTRLDAPEQAVDVLRRAVVIAPDDRRLRSMLAEGLRARGDLDEAKEMLESAIKAFGRRGSKERAQAHMQLARVLHAQGDTEGALAQLDTATKMDADNVESLQTLADFARDAGELQRAEAALRMLLLTARRLAADDRVETPIGTSEVLFELASIATARGQEDQAEELAESAIEALAEGDAHAPRLQKKLRDKGEHALLARLLDARLQYVRSPYRRGQILLEKAESWQSMGETARAFAARLEAIEADPGSPLLHDGLQEMAASLDKLPTYEDELNELLDKARRDTDAMIRCEVLLRLGEIAQTRKEYDAASERFARAQETGVREVDVLRAMARIAGDRGNDEEQMRILERLASLGEDQAESRADALYRMAEVQLAAKDSLEIGLESLRKAISDNPSPKRAATILRRATEQNPDHSELLDLYEQVVRDSGDDATILHYLQRRAEHGSATPAQVREAVQRAQALDDEARAESLMRRAVDLARERDNLHEVDWALLGLAERALANNDVKGAVQWLQDAGEVAEAEALFALSRQVAELAAGDAGEPQLAAGLYEKLRERDAMAREAWEPLVRIYTELDDLESLERVVRETLDGLQEVDDRNTLRMGLARALLKHEARVDDAINVTREALFDAPGHSEALSLLTTSLERAGRTDELSDLLRDQLIGAKERGDAETVKATAMRLVGMLEREPASEVLRDALEMGDDAELIEALLERLGDDDASERAELVERQLNIAESDAAAALAKQAAELFGAVDNADGVLRVLEAGMERAPGDAEIRERLEKHYRDQDDHEGLARILESTAATTDDPDQKAHLMTEAARVHLDHLGDADAAAALLAQARTLSPTNAELTTAHAQAVAATGDRDAAIGILGEGLERCDPSHHLSLLRARAELRREEGDDDGVIADLDAAFAIDAAAVREQLADALESRRMRAAGDDDQEAERRITLRIADLLLDEGRRDDARMMLTDFADRHEDELEITQRLVQLARDDEQWEEVERLGYRLVEALSGEEQIGAVANLFEACERLGRPESAREVLERVWAEQPGNSNIRSEVRRLYELIGAHAELARLLIEEAQDIDDIEERVAHLRWAGEALLSTGDLEPAVDALQQVLAAIEDDAEALCLLADAHIMQGDYGGAHELLDDAIGRARRTSPTLFMLYQRKSYVHQAEGDPYAQLDALKRAYQAARKNPHVAAELADLAESLEDWDLAVTTLRAITAMEDQGPVSPALALVRQGRIALRLGDEKRAKLCARRAAMTNAEDEQVQAFLAELGEG